MNQVVKKETTKLANAQERPSWLGRSLSVDQKVPRLLLMQGTSEFVQEEKAKAGDVVRSTTGVKVGGIGKNIPMILLSYPKHEWIIEVKAGKKFEFVRTLPRTPQNQDQKWKYFADEDGNEVPEGTKGALEANRVRMGSFFALLPGDMDAFNVEMEKVKKGGIPDLSIEMTPVQVRCRSFSYEASLNVEKMLQKIASFKCQPWQFIVELSVKKMENDDNAWYVYDFDLRQKGTPISDVYKETAHSLFDFVQQNMERLVVDDSVEQPSDSAAPASESKGQF